jgi:hypothetical protein
MAIASVTEWLRNEPKNFHQGRMIYQQYGEDLLTLTIIKSGTGSYHLSKLIAGMEDLNKLQNLKPKHIKIPDVFVAPPEPGSKDPLQKTNLDYAPKEIQAIRDNKNLLYAQARNLHASVRVLDDQQQRLEAGLKILDNMDKVNEAWIIMDEWAATGVVKEAQAKEIEKTVSDFTLIELIKAQNNLPPNISKYKSSYKNAKDPAKKAMYLAKMEAASAQLKAIKSKINELI